MPDPCDSSASTPADVLWITLDGRSLTPARLADLAGGDVRVRADGPARQRVAAAAADLAAVAGARPVYGRSTGVGANRGVPVEPAEQAGHGRRLLRSHCAAAGPAAGDALVRATLAVRANQLLAGGSGIDPAVVDALVAALDGGVLPDLHEGGSIGTGDLSALAEVALTLAGERPWRTGSLPPVALSTADSLAFLSSNAVTLAVAALAAHRLTDLRRAGDLVAAVSFLALEGAAEAWADLRGAGPQHPAEVATAARLRGLVGAPGPARRLQDPYGLRALPQVAGALVAAADELGRVLAVELNTARENPLLLTGPAGPGVAHHAGFHQARLAVALDTVRAALVPFAGLAQARLGHLLDPRLSGLPAFLAHGPAGSSGVMILEYVAADALAELRALAAPVTTGGAWLSLGMEEHASFATQAARALRRAGDLLPGLLAAELVAAVRALRLAPDRLPATGSPAAAAARRALAALPADLGDRPLDADLRSALALLPELQTWGAGSTGRSSSA